MSDQQRADARRPLSSDVADANTASDPATLREVFRAKHRLAVSVMERPQQYRVTYSLGDIHRLTFLSHEERTAVETEWHAWHRKYVRLSRAAFCLWLSGVAVALVCWMATDALVAGVGGAVGLTIPAMWWKVIGGVVAVTLLATLPAFLAATSASALCDSYLRGYTDGLTRGVNRALHITPEIEQEMWDELRQAERLDAGWRRVTEAPLQK